MPDFENSEETKNSIVQNSLENEETDENLATAPTETREIENNSPDSMEIEENENNDDNTAQEKENSDEDENDDPDECVKMEEMSDQEIPEAPGKLF